MIFLHRSQPPFLKALRSFPYSPKLIHLPNSERPSRSRSSRRRDVAEQFLLFISREFTWDGSQGAFSSLLPSTISLFFLSLQWLWNLYILLPRESRTPCLPSCREEQAAPLISVNQGKKSLTEWSGGGGWGGRSYRCKQGPEPRFEQ